MKIRFFKVEANLHCPGMELVEYVVDHIQHIEGSLLGLHLLVASKHHVHLLAEAVEDGAGLPTQLQVHVLGKGCARMGSCTQQRRDIDDFFCSPQMGGPKKVKNPVPVWI